MNLHSVLKRMLHGVLLACALCANSITAAAEPPASVPVRIEAEHAIRHLLMQTFDRPEERLAVEPVVVRGRHAIAGWIQGPRGGRALLRQDEHGRWQVLLCAGEALRTAPLLRESGVPAAEATALAAALAEAEKGLPTGRAALLSTFEGVVRISGKDPHGHHGHHGH